MTKNGLKKQKGKMKLMAYHNEAVELRYAGQTYGEIAAALGTKYDKDFKPDRVRKWFQKNGILETLYLDYAKKENDRRRQFIMEELKKVMPFIPQSYMAILNREIEALSKGQQIYHDDVKRKILKDLCGLLGFKIEPSDDGGEDPIDRYFDRAEKELGLDDEEEKPEKPAAAA